MITGNFSSLTLLMARTIRKISIFHYTSLGCFYVTTAHMLGHSERNKKIIQQESI
jgi:hypothetical protein